MNTGVIERAAVRAVEGYLDKCPKLEVHIDPNDITPIWDGDVYIYKNKEKKTENFFARVPLVVKGTSNVINYSYRINREYLDGFKAERGAVFFMVQVGDNTSKILYALLSSKDIEILLQQTTDTIRINLNEVPDIPLKFEQRILDFATKGNKEEVENTSPKEILELVKGFEEIRKHLDEVEDKEARFVLEGLLDNIKNIKENDTKKDDTIGWRDKFYYLSRKAIDLASNIIENFDFADLQFKLGKYLQDQKQYHLVKDYFSNALEEYRKRADKVNEAVTHNNRGQLYRALTRYDDAEKEYNAALEIRRELAKTNRDAYIGDVAQTLNNLGNLHSDLARYDEAEKEYNEALNIYRELAKTNYDAYIFYVSRTLNNLAALHKNLNRSDEAEKEYKEALEIRRELAKNDRDAYIGNVANILNNLAALHDDLTRSDEAEKEYNEALEIYRELAKTNQDAYIEYVATTLNNLGELHRVLTRSDEAEKEYKEALEIFRELAKNNRDAYIEYVATTLNNLGELHFNFDQNKEAEKEYKKEAEREYKEALEIRRELAKTNRDAYIRDLAMTLNNLAVLHNYLSRYSEAEKEYMETLEIYRELAKTDRDAYIEYVATTLYNLAVLHKNLTRNDEAKKYAEEALGIYKELADKYPQIWNGYVEKTERLLDDLSN
jgi:tetratricopeptide (TPR) repeat protein